MNLICRIKGHKWNKCRCARCGETAPEYMDLHQWKGCRCVSCGLVSPSRCTHEWVYDGTHKEGGDPDMNSGNPWDGYDVDDYHCIHCGEVKSVEK